MRAGAECGESYATCWYVDGQSSVLHRLVAERRTPVAEKPGHRDVSRGEEMKFGLFADRPFRDARPYLRFCTGPINRRKYDAWRTPQQSLFAGWTRVARREYHA